MGLSEVPTLEVALVKEDNQHAHRIGSATVRKVELDLQPNRDFSKRTFFTWYDPNDGPLERRLVLKLDFFILSFAFIGFWIVYIDRGILSNAYVSGMREDLGFYSNELVQVTAIFNAGYCISMIPATLLVTKYPAQYVIPTCTFLWGAFTLLCYRSHGFSELATYRFFVGLLEGPYFCSIHYILGSWYRTDELMRRAGIFYVSAGLGTMTTSLLAASIYASLDGHLGIAGWRWMYIIGAIMTFPVAIWGFIALPGTPNNHRRWFFTEEEFQLARERMRLEGRLQPRGITLTAESAKRFLGRWHFWILVPWNVMWLLGYEGMSQGSQTLWLKSIPQYSVVEVNNYSAVSPGVGIVAIWSFAWIADKVGTRAVLPLVAFVCVVGFATKFAWLLYDSTPFAYKWVAVATSYLEVSLSPVIYSLTNLACAADAEERAFVISSMLSIGTAFGVWVPLLAFPTIEAPRFFKGYVMETVMQVLYPLWTVIVIWFISRDKSHERADTGSEREDSIVNSPGPV